MGDVEDPSMGLNKMLHGGATAKDGGKMSTKSISTSSSGCETPIEHQTLNPPHPKRYNSGSTQSSFQMHKTPFLDSPPNLLQLPSSIKKTSAIDELDHHHHQRIIDQLFKATEMVQSGNNPVLAQLILVRLNHQLSPVGKPFDRAAFYFKEALQLLIHSVVNNMNSIASPFSLIFKIGAYKSFSEVSPLVQFTNFTCNQALLEVLDGFDQVHIVDRG
ncbi:scarecrow-like protein 6 [Helianthus annuus]|uniref:scarecrow-like protein 6 n=1 Tax=Helianthus annuus TaxID=4232 RepID=UPI000B8F2EE4|nr:scarecrow-like protein 6 [Helianthus annuus]